MYDHSLVIYTVLSYYYYFSPNIELLLITMYLYTFYSVSPFGFTQYCRIDDIFFCTFVTILNICTYLCCNNFASLDFFLEIAIKINIY